MSEFKTRKQPSLLNLIGGIVKAVEKKAIEKKRNEGALTKSFVKKRSIYQ